MFNNTDEPKCEARAMEQPTTDDGAIAPHQLTFRFILACSS
jgi:hypothetical protein